MRGTRRKERRIQKKLLVGPLSFDRSNFAYQHQKVLYLHRYISCLHSFRNTHIYKCVCVCVRAITIRLKKRAISLYLTFGPNRRLLLLFFLSLILFCYRYHFEMHTRLRTKSKVSILISINISCIFHFFCAWSLFLLLFSAFFNPNTIAAILDSGVYPSFFFLYMRVNAHTFFIAQLFLFVLMIYDGRRGKKLCVCVFTTLRYETKRQT